MYCYMLNWLFLSLQEQLVLIINFQLSIALKYRTGRSSLSDTLVQYTSSSECGTVSLRYLRVFSVFNFLLVECLVLSYCCNDLQCQWTAFVVATSASASFLYLSSSSRNHYLEPPKCKAASPVSVLLWIFNKYLFIKHSILVN